MINYLTADLCEVLAKYGLELVKLDVQEPSQPAVERPDESQIPEAKTYYIQAKEIL